MLLERRFAVGTTVERKCAAPVVYANGTRSEGNFVHQVVDPVSRRHSDKMQRSGGNALRVSLACISRVIDE